MIATDLQRLIDEHQWDLVISLISSNPALCRKRYSVHFVTDGNETTECLPIHHACSKITVPMPLIQAMIRAYPESICQREYSLLRTCIHIAILKCLPDTIISTLIEASPSAVKVQDRFDRVPLHYATSNLRSFDLIKKLIMPFPQCIIAPDWKNWTSVHVAVTKNTHIDIIEFMIELCPDVVLMKTKNGKTPLELMMDENEDEFGNHKVKMPLEQRVKLSKLILDKIDKLNDSPETKNYMEASTRPLVELNPYGIV